MPELPEVETIRTYLAEGRGPDQPAILGRQITAARLLWPRTLANLDAAHLEPRLRGQTVAAVARRGKFLMLNLSDDWLLIHLRMSGDLLLEPWDAPLGPHHRLTLDFAPLSGEAAPLRLAFTDARKFGRVWLTADPQEIVAKLGREPLDPELTAAEFHTLITASQRALKPRLLDQTVIAGLGNIYTDEALHRAGLHPLRRAASLTPDETARLLEAIRVVLSAGIARHGASIDWVYRGGDFQNQLQAYRRTGQPCPVCGTPIERRIVGQRSTHFCPRCQPEP
jgi:formamidopyrimidine-DNA glycosylase